MQNYKVYVHIFPNGKKYVGITKQTLDRRWQNGNGYKGQFVYNAIKKYGWHNVEHKVLYTNLTKEEAEELEIKIIKEWKTNKKEFGYNIESGGNLNKEISKETREKLRIANSGNEPWIKGKHHTEKSKELNRQKHIGKEAWNKGKSFDMKSRKKMSKSKKKLYEEGWLPSNAKRVICLELNRIYNSAKEAARDLHINSSHISSCCTGKRNSTGGYHFRYFDKEGGDAYEPKPIR